MKAVQMFDNDRRKGELIFLAAQVRMIVEDELKRPIADLSRDLKGYIRMEILAAMAEMEKNRETND